MTVKELKEKLDEFKDDVIIRIWDGWGQQDIKNISYGTDEDTGDPIVEFILDI